MPLPDRQTIRLALLNFLRDGQVHRSDEIEHGLISHFGLIAEDITEVTKAGRTKFGNEIDWAKVELQQQGLLVKTASKHYQITPRGGLGTDPETPFPAAGTAASAWIEKTTVKGRQDRQAGPHRLGEALWSPQAAVDGRDVYANMRDVKPGDMVLHLADNEAFIGISWAAEAANADFLGVSGTEWGDRPCYRIQLRGFVSLNPPLQRDWLLKDEAVGAQIRAIAEQPRGRGLFYNAKLELNQGAYLTAVPAALLEVLQRVYHQRTGEELPVPLRPRQSGSTINESRLAAAVRFFRWIYGSTGFSSDRYLQEERNYKAAFSGKWRAAVTLASLDAALANDDASVTLATEIGRLLTDQKISNLLSWRYGGVLKGPWAADRAKVFLAATRQLLFEGPREAPSVDEFNAVMAPFYVRLLTEDGSKPASHCIPSLMLWLSEPERQFFVRPDLYNQACRSLLGAVAEGQGGIMSTTYYVRAQQFAVSVKTLLTNAGMPARDLIDVQGFLWGVFRASRIWFGGHSDGRRKDMLPEFVTHSMYAIDWACRPEVAELFKGAGDLSPEDRKARLAELEKILTQVGERKALTTLFDLVGRPGTRLLAKAVMYDQSTKQSLIRLSAVAETKDEYNFDETRGHELRAEWLSQFSETFVLPSRLFPLLNGTLASLPIADALDAFSTPYTVKGGAEIDQDDDIERRDDPSEIKVKVERVPYPLTRALEGLFMPQEEFERLLRVWRHKRNLVLQGAPGVGKSFVARRLAYALIGYEDPSRVQMIQFHQSYAYEDFVQGFRPTTEGKFVLRDGVFIDFCNKALADPGESYVFVIDEINRGNLSKILGELMLLIENDKRSAKWAVKLAYSDNDAPKFHVPENVYLLGLMNTADRSLAVIDYALRRRFAFITLRPAFEQAKFHDYLSGVGAPAELVRRITGKMSTLNAKIEKDLTNLGPGFCIGHSFFVPNDDDTALADEWYREIINTEIAPLLEEYWFDNPTEAKRWLEELLG